MMASNYRFVNTLGDEKIKLILELVKKKEERDMNKWMVWYGH